MPASEDNSPHLEGVAGALGCMWRGADPEQEGLYLRGQPTLSEDALPLFPPKTTPVLIFLFKNRNNWPWNS